MYYNPYYQGERQFLVPFLLGGLGGAAIVSASRPRPVYAVNYTQQPTPNYAPYSYGPYGYNYYSSYNYYPLR